MPPYLLNQVFLDKQIVNSLKGTEEYTITKALTLAYSKLCVDIGLMY